MLRRLPIIPTVFVIAAVALMIWLGVWQLQRARWKEALLARYAHAETLPPIVYPIAPLRDNQLPLFRHATGMCQRVTGQGAQAGENRAGDPGYVHIVYCATGAEGPGMSVEVGWSQDPNANVNWKGGLVSGVIVADRRSRLRLVAASAAPGLEPSKVPDVTTASPITPTGHRGYAATWFSLAAAALVIYGLAVRKRFKEGPK